MLHVCVYLNELGFGGKVDVSKLKTGIKKSCMQNPELLKKGLRTNPIKRKKLIFCICTVFCPDFRIHFIPVSFPRGGVASPPCYTEHIAECIVSNSSGAKSTFTGEHEHPADFVHTDVLPGTSRPYPIGFFQTTCTVCSLYFFK